MSTPVVLHSRSLFRTEVDAGPHHWVLDEPVDAGGGGEGPTPYDMLAAALGGCTSMTLHFAKDCSDCSAQSGWIHRFKVEIALHGPLDDEQRQRLLAIAARCPVAKTLQNEIRIDEVLV